MEQTVAKPRRERSQTPNNAAESLFFEKATAAGWEVSKRGWPDFFCIRGDTVMVVEVKPDAAKGLKDQQRAVLEALARHGIECYVWRPEDGFERITAPEATTGTFKEGDVEVQSETPEGQTLLEGTGEPFSSPEGIPEVTAAINHVWAHYVKVMRPRSDIAGEDARRIIRQALKVAQGETEMERAEELCRAIDGCAASPFHMGKNERGRKYNKIGQILKGRPRRNETTRDRLDFFIDKWEQADAGLGNIPSADAAIVQQRVAEVRRGHRLPDDVEVQRTAEQAEEWLKQRGIETVRDANGYPRFRRIDVGGNTGR
jgi:hypothetical protein